MISETGARDLMAIADRLERASVACRRDPERPYAERGQLAAEIRELVYAERRRIEPVARVALQVGVVSILGRPVAVVRRRP